MTAITFHVTEIRQERVEVLHFGNKNADAVTGESTVVLRSQFEEITLRWTWRDGPLPEIGSTWTLTQEPT